MTIQNINIIDKIILPEDVLEILSKAPSVKFASSIEELEALACGTKEKKEWNVTFKLPDGSEFLEAEVVRVKNGISVNYTEPYMRRRDPDCLLVADKGPSDKPRFNEKFDYPFDNLRKETFSWLSSQELAVFAFEMGQPGLVGDALAICPANTGFFAFGLGLLQGVVNLKELNHPFEPKMIIYVAPTFRHTHFGGKQIVVHNRIAQHEIFSYNLYPGPSAKKGVYGAMIHVGALNDWATVHCSSVQVVTPYDNIVNFMHEGASGGGKSEMLQQPHRMSDGRIKVGKNIINGDKIFLEIKRTCDLNPVCDDMGLCHPSFQKDDGKLRIMDAENAWFVRVDHIKNYGTDHDLEKLTVSPSKPLLFLSLDAVAGSTALIWEHTQDEPGKLCPNPRVILPRDIVPSVINEQIAIDVRSFGVRTPPCTQEKPTYGILGFFHVLPPALAWLWRLVAPRGHSNPSIVDVDSMSSEGVGSYWPFTTGKKVDQANLLLKQFIKSYQTRYILTPNQYIGVWEIGFMPQWLTRDYLARRGSAPFLPDQLIPSRCPLLGYSLKSIRIEGVIIPSVLLRVETQPEVGEETYDKGAQILTEFFHKQIKKFLQPELDELGRKIIESCLSGASIEDYEKLIETKNI